MIHTLRAAREWSPSWARRGDAGARKLMRGWRAQKARKQREDAKARKAENQKKALVTQRISNPATLKRMMKSKKERKKLLTSDTV